MRFRAEIQRCNPSLKGLRPVVKSWFGVLREYITEVTDDTPFRYRERPQVGFFATAAWKRRWIALEEWRTKKGSRRDSGYGRNDLWIKKKKVKENWYIEAKHTFCDIHKGAVNVRQIISNELADAVRCAEMNFDCDSRLAALFVSLVWKGDKVDRQQAIETTQNEFVAAFSPLKADLTATVLASPQNFATDKIRRWQGEKGELFVGCALLLKSCSAE